MRALVVTRTNTAVASLFVAVLVACARIPPQKLPVATTEKQLVGSTQTQIPAPPPVMRLISVKQYQNAIADTFGSDIRVQMRFAPPKRTKGLATLGSGTAAVTAGSFDQFVEAAHAVATQVVDDTHRRYLVRCTPRFPEKPDDACATKFFGDVGPMLFRRPLSSEELHEFVRVASNGANRLNDFYSGLAFALEGMLVSPRFLYITETVEPDPARPGSVRLDANSKATRLSLLLWDAFPDGPLMAAADKGELHTKKGLSRQVDRMLASPRLEGGVRAFFVDFLVFENFSTLAKDPKIYPAFTAKVATDAQEQTLRTITDHLLVQDGDYRELFTSGKTFLSMSLAAFYKIPVADPEQWTPYEFPQGSEQAGLLSQISFVALYAHPGRSSATKRGKALREVFLCQTIPNPPPNVDFSIVESNSKHLKTARERVTLHMQSPACAGCHRVTDPVGLSLEDFDGAGELRANEGGEAIDLSGELEGVKFKGAAGLGQAMYKSKTVSACFVSRLSSYALGRPITAAEEPFVKDLTRDFSAQGYRLRPLLRAIATSDEMYAVSSPKVEALPLTTQATATLGGKN